MRRLERRGRPIRNWCPESEVHSMTAARGGAGPAGKRVPASPRSTRASPLPRSCDPPGEKQDGMIGDPARESPAVVEHPVALCRLSRHRTATGRERISSIIPAALHQRTRGPIGWPVTAFVPPPEARLAGQVGRPFRRRTRFPAGPWGFCMCGSRGGADDRCVSSASRRALPPQPAPNRDR